MQDSCNLIDLGCGDGTKASLFLRELEKHISVRYCPVDISSYMVSKAAETVRSLDIDGEVVQFKWNISDFENLNNITPLLREKGFENHFLMLLGNTLGNFDRDDILHGIKNSMHKGDILLIGNGISNGKQKEEWVKEYKDKLINRWLIQIPLQLGLKEDEILYDVRFENSRIEEIYHLTKDRKISHLGRSLQLRKGDMIIAAISYKYTKDELYEILSKFFEVEIRTNRQNSYALALCR